MSEQLPRFLEDVSPEFLRALQHLVQTHTADLAKALVPIESGVTEPVQPMLKESYTKTLSEECEQPVAQVVGDEHKYLQQMPPAKAQSKSDADCNDNIVEQTAVGGTALASALAILQDGDPQMSMSEVNRFLCFEEVKRTNAVAGPASEISLFGNVADQLGDGTEIDEPEYDVCNFYHETGFSQAVARNHIFGYATLVVICLNAVYLGVESDFTRAGGEVDDFMQVPFLICSNFFCLFFLFEWVCRFLAFEHKRDCCRDGWFKFDSFLVFTMLLDTWVMPIVEKVSGFEGGLPGIGLLRLLRLARMVRICHALPELATLMKGIFVATRAVGSAILLLIVIIYAWAIAMHSLLKDDPDVFMYFGTVTRCMMTLIANGTLGDSIGTVMRAIARNVPALTFFLAFVLLSAITVTNMLIGLLCEVVSEVANAEKEYATLSKLKSTLLVTLKRLDKDGSGDISKEELLGLLKDDSAKIVLGDLGIDAKHLVEFTDMIFHSQPGELDDKSMSIPEVMQMLLDSQGKRQPNFQDLVSMLSFTRWSMKQDMVSVKSDMLTIKGDVKSELLLIKKEITAVNAMRKGTVQGLDRLAYDAHLIQISL